jgi:hypothetical protein
VPERAKLLRDEPLQLDARVVGRDDEAHGGRVIEDAGAATFQGRRRAVRRIVGPRR